jgi:hypothetical protein
MALILGQDLWWRQGVNRTQIGISTFRKDSFSNRYKQRHNLRRPDLLRFRILQRWHLKTTYLDFIFRMKWQASSSSVRIKFCMLNKHNLTKIELSQVVIRRKSHLWLQTTRCMHLDVSLTTWMVKSPVLIWQASIWWWASKTQLLNLLA